ncbi:MAG: protein kinase [Pirellulales bacterium]|nr:protein kinase [Pirellulales bacterium]
MSFKEVCPDETKIEQMLDGTLPSEAQRRIALHLENCPACQDKFEQFARRATLLPEGAPQPDERRQETVLHRLMEKLSGGRPEAGEQADSPQGEEPYLPFLHPADDPEHLGRLGPYDVISMIGQGGMGVVLKAYDPRLNRFVAIKVLAPQWASNAAARKRFLREAQAAAAVSHEHVVTIHAVDEAEGFPYFVMHYVLGVSLAERIRRTGPLGLKETLRIGAQIASGLAAAHAQGLIHRDIKPANILLENGVERVKITDFGLARVAGEIQLTQTGQVAGTPEYMSPEQARGQALDHRSDLFSLGCVLYAMIAGRSPFASSSVWDVMDRVCNHPPRRLQEVDPETPGWLAEIIEKLLAKNPDDRIQSAAEVAKLLNWRLAQLQQVHADPPIHSSSNLGLTEVRSEPGRVGPDGPGRHAPALKAMRKIGADAPRRSPARVWVVAATLLLLIGTLGVTEATGVTQLTATVIRIFRPEGTLEIVVDDPGVQVAVDGEEIGIEGAGPHEIRLRLGKHQIEVLKNGKPVYQDLVTVNRGGKQVVKIGLAPPDKPAEESPAGKSRKIKSFTPEEKTITQDGMTVKGNAWRIEARENRTVRLFEIPDPGVEDCTVFYRAKMKSEGLVGRAYLEMWCRSPDFGEAFSRGLMNPVGGTTDWASYGIPFFLKKGERTDLIKLNVVIEGKGTLWIKDLELIKGPLRPLATR